MSKSLQSMNNEMKVYLNEASGISNKCRSKLLKLVEKYFYVDLPDENYLNIDISIQENGNIVMRDVVYSTSKDLTEEDTLDSRYSEFKKEVEELLDKKATNFDSMKQKNQILNLVIVILMIIVALILFGYGIRLLIFGDLRGFIWFVIIIGYYLIPATGHRFNDRLIQAKNYIKSLFKK